MNHQILISVFTSTYNRADSIYRVYDSLKKQTCKNFEWILIDDGSTDNTDMVIQRILSEKIITIHHIRFNKNSGKHIAHNKAIEIASGELFSIVDSDWELEENALQYAINCWFNIPEQEKNALFAMYFGCNLVDGASHSLSISAEYVITDEIEMQYKLKLSGDCWTVGKTSVFREYLFPGDFVGHYYPEGIIWKRISQNYKIIVYSKELCVIHFDNENSISRGKRTLQSAAKYVCLVAADDLNNYLKYAISSPQLFINTIIRFFVYSFFTQNLITTWKTLNVTSALLVLLFLPFDIAGLLVFYVIQIYRKINGTSAFS
jgi:Glycosyltransferases involved in cell wall biogenesis